MFPVFESRARIDDYGEILDLELFSKLDQQNVPNEEEYIDFEGRADGRSMRNILTQIAPRKVVLVHGDYAATHELANFFKTSQNLTHEVHIPAPGDYVNVSSASNLYRVVLTDTLISTLHMSKLHDHQLSHISGVIRMQPTVTGGRRALLDLVPIEEQKSRKPTMVGDLKLSEVRKLLQDNGFTTQFASAGVLVVNGVLVIRRLIQGGSLVVEGRVSSDYYRVRALLYSEQAVL
eukprot:jgi/Hompol1/2641/HPOL_000480-RA